MSAIKQDLKKLDQKELHQKVIELRQELFKVRLSSFSAPIKDHTQFKRLRRDIARALTYLRQKGVGA